jgi:hypothetical protein
MKMKVIPVGFCLAIGATAAEAATTPNSIVTPQTPNRGIVQFLQGTDNAGTYKTLYTAGANGSRCYGMLMNNNDASTTHLVTVQIVNGGVKYGGTALTTALSAGFSNSTTAQPLMSPSVWPGLPLDQYGNPYIQMISGDTIQATFATSLTTSDLINLYVTCSDF